MFYFLRFPESIFFYNHSPTQPLAPLQTYCTMKIAGVFLGWGWNLRKEMVLRHLHLLLAVSLPAMLDVWAIPGGTDLGNRELRKSMGWDQFIFLLPRPTVLGPGTLRPFRKNRSTPWPLSKWVKENISMYISNVGPVSMIQMPTWAVNLTHWEGPSLGQAKICGLHSVRQLNILKWGNFVFTVFPTPFLTSVPFSQRCRPRMVLGEFCTLAHKHQARILFIYIFIIFF